VTTGEEVPTPGVLVVELEEVTELVVLVVLVVLLV
jgi:hypothetical protein